MILGGVCAQGQIANRFQLSIGGGGHYDLYTPSNDANMGNVPIEDARSYNSSYDEINWMGQGRLTFMLSPTWGLYGEYTKGTLSGSSNETYYRNRLNEAALGVRFYPGNENRNHIGSHWNLVPMVGITHTWFDSELFFKGDNSLQNYLHTEAWGLQGGLELSYAFNSHWSMYLSAQYLSVFHDGFDGWDYGSGSDAYLRGGLGITYRFTSAEKPNLADCNVFDNAKALEDTLARLTKSVQADMASIQTKLTEVEEAQAAIETTQEEMAEDVETLQAQVSELNEKATQYHTAVFFNTESSRLSQEMKLDLYKFILSINANTGLKKYKLVVMGYTDKTGSARYNARLRQKRANEVKRFLADNGMKCEIEITEIVVEHSSTLMFDRRVEVVLKEVQ